jgi:hypothetical protein
LTKWWNEQVTRTRRELEGIKRITKEKVEAMKIEGLVECGTK